MDMYVRNLVAGHEFRVYSVEALILLYLVTIEKIHGLNLLSLGIQTTAELDTTSYKEFMGIITSNQIIRRNRLIVNEDNYDNVVSNRLEINLGLINKDEALIAYVNNSTGNVWDFKIECGHIDESRDKQLDNQVQKIKLKYSLAGKKCNIYLIGDKLFEIAHDGKHIHITPEHTGFIYTGEDTKAPFGSMEPYAPCRYSTPTIFDKLKFIYGFEFRTNKVYAEYSIAEAARNIGIDFGDMLGIQESTFINGVYNIDSAISIRLIEIKNSLVRISLTSSLNIQRITNSILELEKVASIYIAKARNSTFIISSDLSFEDLLTLRCMIRVKTTLKFILKYAGQHVNYTLIKDFILIFSEATIYVASELNKSKLGDMKNVVWYDSRNYDWLLKEIRMEYNI